jgi:hypothetical protein
MKKWSCSKQGSMNCTRRIITLLTVLGVGAWAATLRAEDALTLKLVKVDSEETAGEDGKGANAVDGDPATIWHTQWQDASPAHPHEIIIELSRAATIKGFTYLPRQDENANGSIKDYEFYVSDDGKEFGQAVKKGTFEEGKERKTVTFEPKPCRFIKLTALSEVNGEAWTSAAEIAVVQVDEKTAARPTLKLVSVDSEETAGEDGKGANAVDGDLATFWHTQWQDASPAHPHQIIIELQPPSRIRGFTYLPRQDEGINGGIKDYEFFVSDDGKDFGPAVKQGTFEADKEKKTVTFEPKSCGFIKLKALSEINGEAWTSAAEIDVLVADQPGKSGGVSPSHFWFDYPFEPSPGKRFWTRVDQSWVEQYESGDYSRFKVLERSTVGENSGTVVVKVTGDPEKTQTGNEGNFQAFIPDVGSEKMEFWFRRKADGEWEAWRKLADLQGVE